MIPAHKRLVFRIATQMLGVVVAALLLNAYLNYSNFDKTQRQLAESRILVSTGEVKRAVSGALELGLSLEELSNLGEILQRGLDRGRAAGIEDLSILNNDGALIASSSATPPDWSGVESWPIERQQKETLRSLATDRFAIGMPLMNAFGEQSGWFIIAYDGQEQLRARSKMRDETLVNLLIALALAVCTLIVGVYWLTRPFLQGLAKIRAADAAGAGAVDSQLAELASEYARFSRETSDLLKADAAEPSKEASRAS